MDMDSSDDSGGGDGMDVMDLSMMDGAGGGVIAGPGNLFMDNKAKLDNLKVQTLLALQELGIVIAVAFMVGGIFMLMIFVEKIWDSVMTVYQRKFGGGESETDIEDPAALVGTFKRYKN